MEEEFRVTLIIEPEGKTFNQETIEAIGKDINQLNDGGVDDVEVEKNDDGELDVYLVALGQPVQTEELQELARKHGVKISADTQCFVRKIVECSINSNGEVVTQEESYEE